MKRWLRHLTSLRFNTLFIRNLRLIALGITLPLVAAALAIYAFSQQILTQELDAANMRALTKVQSIMDMTIDETARISLHISIDSHVQSFLSIRKTPYSDYRSIETAQRSIYAMQLSQRLKLDHSILLFSGINDYVLHTTNGGQRATMYTDQDCITTFLNGYRNNEPIWYALRQARVAPDATAQTVSLLTHYRRVPAANPEQVDFVAVNLDISQLNNLLVGVREEYGSDVLVLDRQNQIVISNAKQDLGRSIDDYLANPSAVGNIIEQSTGALHTEVAGQKVRLSWMSSVNGDWKYLQLVPYSTFAANSSNLRRFLILSIIIGLMISIIVSFAISIRVFKPISVILALLENPRTAGKLDDYDGEVRSILMHILEAYQKNVTLEQEMLQRMSMLKSARVRALQHQMTPHFLYNALQAINWLVMMDTKKEDSSSSRAIVTLAELVRACMEFGDSLASVKDEIEYVKKYLEIQKIRFSDQLNATIVCPPELLEGTMPRISLQPLVENAIIHGIQKGSGSGRIHIEIRQADQPEKSLLVTVDDNGPGMPDDQIEVFNESFRTEYMVSTQHVGLQNLNQRVRLLFGDAFGLQLKQGHSGGLQVQLVLPWVVFSAQK
ncbi:MAG: histidine kinase [Anaerolineaceae bacterium]|nr:histidine kinase [Anaerolineaceae bacterium]